jgi:protein NrfD
MTEVDLYRFNHLIDPQLHFWGWEVPVYLFLGGLAAGIMILSALLTRAGANGEDGAASKWLRWAPFAVPVILSLGMGALFLDLEYKLHVYRFYLSFEWTSPMSWGSWLLLVVYPASALLGFGLLTSAEIDGLAAFRPVKALRLGGLLRWVAALGRTHRDNLGWVNIVVGVGLGVYTGVLLGSLGARAVWNSSILGPLFLVSGFSSGAAFLMMLPVGDAAKHRLARIDAMAIVAELVIVVLFLLGLATGGTGAREAAALFLGGNYTATFWSLVVILGLIIPLVFDLIEERLHRSPALVAPALVLIGGFALRWIIVSAGQAI